MKIVIPDDYQDMVDQLACFSLIRHHDVVRYREPAPSLAALVDRLRDADVVVSIRERVEFSRALLERLPKLKLLALVGRNSQAIDFAACTDARHSSLHRREQFARRAGRADARLDRRLASQRRARSRAHEARRMAVHAVAPAARIDAGHFRARRHRTTGRRGRARVGHAYPGLGPRELAQAGGRRGICRRRQQGRTVRTLGCAVAAVCGYAPRPAGSWARTILPA